MRANTRKAVSVAATGIFVGGVAALAVGCVLTMTPLIIGGVLMIMAGALACMMTCVASRSYAA